MGDAFYKGWAAGEQLAQDRRRDEIINRENARQDELMGRQRKEWGAEDNADVAVANYLKELSSGSPAQAGMPGPDSFGPAGYGSEGAGVDPKDTMHQFTKPGTPKEISVDQARGLLTKYVPEVIGSRTGLQKLMAAYKSIPGVSEEEARRSMSLEVQKAGLMERAKHAASYPFEIGKEQAKFDLDMQKMGREYQYKTALEEFKAATDGTSKVKYDWHAINDEMGTVKGWMVRDPETGQAIGKVDQETGKFEENKQYVPKGINFEAVKAAVSVFNPKASEDELVTRAHEAIRTKRVNDLLLQARARAASVQASQSATGSSGKNVASEADSPQSHTPSTKVPETPKEKLEAAVAPQAQPPGETFVGNAADPYSMLPGQAQYPSLPSAPEGTGQSIIDNLLYGKTQSRTFTKKKAPPAPPRAGKSRDISDIVFNPKAK